MPPGRPPQNCPERQGCRSDASGTMSAPTEGHVGARTRHAGSDSARLYSRAQKLKMSPPPLGQCISGSAGIQGMICRPPARRFCANGAKEPIRSPDIWQRAQIRHGARRRRAQAKAAQARPIKRPEAALSPPHNYKAQFRKMPMLNRNAGTEYCGGPLWS